MDNNEIELVGAPCGYHGPYTFYKAFKYTKNGIVRILSLSEFFFVKLWCDSDLVCIGELQLLWLDKNSEQMLASLRLYFLPEHTPDGRLDHGEDEVLAISEKVVLRVEDLLTWITLDTEWNWGMSSTWSRDVSSPVPAAVKSEDDDDQDPLEQDPLAIHSDVKDPLADCKDPLSADAKPFICTRRSAPALTDSLLDFSDVEKERNLLDDSWTKGVGVMVLSYPRYCRYRALMKRLEDVEDKWLKNSLVAALGGFTSPCKNTKVLFCKDTFDYPDLEGHELLCNHLAPKLKGRPRGKRKKRSISPGGSESNESESSVTIGGSTNARTRLTSTGGRNGLRCNTNNSPRRSTRCVQSTEEKDFLSKLNSFMKSHRTAIGRVPSLGFKEIDLYQFYSKVQKLGGYDKVTSNRMWKVIYDDLGGNQNSTSAATITRRHYERLLLSYERKVKGEEHKPLPILERRRQKSKSASSNDVEIIESKPSTSGERVTPLRQNNDVTVPPIIPENKVFTIPEKKSDGKTSSLRSVRVKPDRMRESLKQDKLNSTSINVSSTSNTPISTSPTTVTSAIVTPITPPVPLPTSMASVLPAPTAPISIPTNVSPKDPPSLAADKPSMENVSVPVQPQTLPDEKENTPEVTNKENMSQEANKTVIEDDDDDEPIEVPYKPKTPEIIDLEDDSQPSPITITPVPEVKKRRLDILKEGGLEVTAIASALEITPITKDPRPSVIHQFNNPPETPKQLGRVSITVSPSVNKMLPPTTMKPISSTPKHLPPPDSISQYRRNMSNPPKSSPYVPQNPSSSLRSPFNNGQIPPQVIQSRSIYSHSEKVVYGNPKVDLQIPAPQLNSHISQLIPSAHKPSGGEVLDLTVKSPQKPIVEIMRIPSVPLPTAVAASSQSSSSSSSYKEPVQKSNNKYSGYNFPPMIDGRVVGSNLEITIVGNPKSSHKSSTIPPSPQKLQIPPTTNHKLSSSSSSSHKRSSNGKFVPNKMGSTSGRLENGKHHNMNHLNISTSSSRSNHRNGSSTSSNSANLVIPTPSPHHSSSSSSNRLSKSDESSSSRHKKQMTQQATSPSSLFPASLYPNYLPQLSAAAAASASKHPFLPMLDSSLYYTAAIAQGLYPPNPMHMAASLPLFPQTPTAEQLQLYKELIAHTSGLRMSFPPVLQESSASITSVGQTSNNSKN